MGLSCESECMTPYRIIDTLTCEVDIISYSKNINENRLFFSRKLINSIPGEKQKEQITNWLAELKHQYLYWTIDWKHVGIVYIV